jgi:hypothetical protein
MSPLIGKKLMTVVMMAALLAIGAAEQAAPIGAAVTTDLLCAKAPMLPDAGQPWHSTRERPGQPY